MNTLILSKDTIQWLLETQEKFDSKLRADKGIDNSMWLSDLDDNHQLAFSVEVHEFINECYDAWKYWKPNRPTERRFLMKQLMSYTSRCFFLINMVMQQKFYLQT